VGRKAQCETAFGTSGKDIDFLVAEESSFPQDALFIRTGIAKRMVGIPATATFRRKQWRNFHRSLGDPRFDSWKKYQDIHVNQKNKYSA
jgi:hypothetical protein